MGRTAHFATPPVSSMTPFLIVNPRSGDRSPSAHELATAARGQGVAVHVLEDGDDAEALARAADADVLGAAAATHAAPGRRSGGRARAPVRLRAVRDPQPLRPGRGPPARRSA